jgi:hypothetical protein
MSKRTMRWASKTTRRRFVLTPRSKHTDNPLAHYHLGFAQGMMGNTTAELVEYQRAAALGLRNCDLFLNMVLARVENGDPDAATDSPQAGCAPR